MGARTYTACAYGAEDYNDAGPLSAFNLLRPCLELLIGFLGFTNVNFVGIGATNTADAASAAANLDRAMIAEVAQIGVRGS